jgi:hypothetical protein
MVPAVVEDRPQDAIRRLGGKGIMLRCRAKVCDFYLCVLFPVSQSPVSGQPCLSGDRLGAQASLSLTASKQFGFILSAAVTFSLQFLWFPRSYHMPIERRTAAAHSHSVRQYTSPDLRVLIISSGPPVRHEVRRNCAFGAHFRRLLLLDSPQASTWIRLRRVQVINWCAASAL